VGRLCLAARVRSTTGVATGRPGAGLGKETEIVSFFGETDCEADLEVTRDREFRSLVPSGSSSLRLIDLAAEALVGTYRRDNTLGGREQ